MTTWIAQHGMTSGDYQAAFAKYVGEGYRLAEVSGYGANGQAHYAAIFNKSAGPAWSSRHGMNSKEYQQEFDDRVEEGYRLVDVSGYSVNGQPQFAAIFDKSTGPAWIARHGMSSDEYQAEFSARVKEGYRLRQVSGYAVGNDAQYVAIFDKSTGPAWIARHGMSSDEYQQEFNARTKEGYRLRQVSGYAVANQARYAAIFEKSTGPGWVSYHDMTAAVYQQQFDKLVREGYRLDRVCGYVVGEITLYAAIWTRNARIPRATNLLKNADFNQPGGQPTLLVVDPAAGFGFMPTAAPAWDVFNNHLTLTTTALLPSTKGGVGAGTMLQVCTDAQDSGLRQSFGALNTGPAKTKSTAWVYVLSGKVGLGTGNVGNTGDHDAVSTTIGEWELLEAPNGVSPANMFIVYATEPGGACFFVDNASVYAA